MKASNGIRQSYICIRSRLLSVQVWDLDNVDLGQYSNHLEWLLSDGDAPALQKGSTCAIVVPDLVELNKPVQIGEGLILDDLVRSCFRFCGNLSLRSAV